VKNVDIAVLALAGLFALQGLRRGLVVTVFSLVGLVVGAYAGAKLAPTILGQEESRYVPLVTLGGAIIVAAFGQSLAGFVARRIRTALFVLPPLKAVDIAAGGVLGAAAGFVLAWAVGAVLLYLPGQTSLRKNVQDSAILAALNDRVPPGRFMDALARIDPFAALTDLPGAEVDPPDAKILRATAVRKARASVVRVTGTACGLGVSGSGWIAARGIVVTAAHVVAGVTEPRLDRNDGRGFVPGRVIAFDPKNDVAVIRAPALTGRPLETTEPSAEASGAILGFPRGGEFQAEAARLGKTIPFITRDAYGRYPVTRTVTLLRGRVEPGHSGGPVVSSDGRVLTTVFAARASGSDSGFGVPTSATEELLEAGGKPLETSCVEK
jgi:uncharacterized membrane protein required for colicin V production